MNTTTRRMTHRRDRRPEAGKRNKRPWSRGNTNARRVTSVAVVAARQEGCGGACHARRRAWRPRWTPDAASGSAGAPCHHALTRERHRAPLALALTPWRRTTDPLTTAPSIHSPFTTDTTGATGATGGAGGDPAAEEDGGGEHEEEEGDGDGDDDDVSAMLRRFDDDLDDGDGDAASGSAGGFSVGGGGLSAGGAASSDLDGSVSASSTSLG